MRTQRAPLLPSDLAAARADYLRLAQFHLFLELAVLASLWVSGRRFVIQPNT